MKTPRWMVANKKNANTVNNKLGTDFKVSGSKISYGDNISKSGYSTGTKKGTYTLVSRNEIRKMGGHGVDVLRHEATHQLDILKGITDIKITEINAYTTNLLNPNTFGTINEVSNILINDWSVNESILFNYLMNMYGGIILANADMLSVSLENKKQIENKY